MIERWSRPNGYRDVLRIGLPMVVSLGSTTVMQFTDRIFLSHYSLEAISAVLPAGIVAFLFLCFFMGVASYVNVFIAQYIGAGRFERVGASLWQGIWFCLMAGVILASLALIAEPLFALAGHPPEVQRLEAVYFRILSLGAFLAILETGLSCFYSGQGLTRVVMLANITGAAVNVPLDYMLINGLGPFPELGIEGAALATVTAWGVILAVYLALIFRPTNEKRFLVVSAWRFDRELFGRLMRFGIPGGIEFFMDIFAVTFFVFVVGRIGKMELAATNIVLSLNNLAFLPMIGFSIGLSTLVGQAIGRGEPEEGAYATVSTLHMIMAWMYGVVLLYVLAPEWLIGLFRTRGYDPAEFAEITRLGVVLLRFVAVYSLFDALTIGYFGALKGAGDVRFTMRLIGMLSLFVMVIPIYVGVEYFGMGIYYSWALLTLYIGLLGTCFRARFRGGKWKEIQVIETH